MKKLIIFTSLLLFIQPATAQKKVTLSSPDNNLKYTLQIDNNGIKYDISYKKHLLIKDAAISFDFDNGEFGKNLRTGKISNTTVEETYQLVVGKVSKARSHYRQAVVPLEEKQAPNRKINLVIRAFDDGIAFRYEFPQQANWNSYVMYDERTGFDLTCNPKLLALHLPNYTTSHEGLYTYEDFNQIESHKLIDMPLMIQYPNGIHMAITEAAVVNYAGLYLMKENGNLTGKLSPKLGQEKIKVEINSFPHHTPWRVLQISDRVGAILESNILTSLNEPCKIEDTSWIQPGKTTFTWWSGNVVPDTTFSPGNNFLTNKYYIDFAARNGLDFHSIYGYAETPWYTDDGFNFGSVGENFDITKPIAPLNMQHICDYAKSKGVGIHVWLNWRALYPKIDEAFALFEKWGIKGMMVDFLDRDDQEMISIQEEILSKAAKHKLFIQFHGSSKPSGLHRTYPNEFTREGTLNYEVYKWDRIINADHDIAMPFTRLLAGATDYHLGGFRAVPQDKFKVQFINPLVTSTRCHMLAMYVVLESYLGMVCDTPQAYEGQPGFDFLQKLPTTWDDIKVPNASVKEYVTIARRKGKEWYIGSLNNSQARQLTINFDFLGDGNYEAEIYTDADDVNVNPNHLNKIVRKISKTDAVTLHLAAGGGAVMRIYPL